MSLKKMMSERAKKAWVTRKKNQKLEEEKEKEEAEHREALRILDEMEKLHKKVNNDQDS